MKPSTGTTTNIPLASTSTSTSTTNNHNDKDDDNNNDNDDPKTSRPLRRGDLVRIADLGPKTSKRFKDRKGHLGRILLCKPSPTTEITSTTTNGSNNDATTTASMTFDVEWVLGGQSKNVLRHELYYTNAEQEGMISVRANDDTTTTTTAATAATAAIGTSSLMIMSRTKRKPIDYMSETIQRDAMKQQQRKKMKLQQQQDAIHNSNNNSNTKASKQINHNKSPKNGVTTTKITSNNRESSSSSSSSPMSSSTKKKRKLVAPSSPSKSLTFVEQSSSATKSTNRATVNNNDSTVPDKKKKSVVVWKQPSLPTKKSTSTTTTANGIAPKKGGNPVKKNTSTNSTKRSAVVTSTKVKLKKSPKIATTENEDETASNPTTEHTTTSSSTTSTMTSTIKPSSIPQQMASATTTNANGVASSSSSSISLQQITSSDIYEKHRREFDRMCTRLMNKIDYFHHFWKKNQPLDYNNVAIINASLKPDADVIMNIVTPDAATTLTNNSKLSANDIIIHPTTTIINNVPTNVDNHNDTSNCNSDIARALSPVLCTGTADNGISSNASDTPLPNRLPLTISTATQLQQEKQNVLPSSSTTSSLPPPLNWETIQQRIQDGYYTLDRIEQEERERKEIFGISFNDPSIINNTTNDQKTNTSYRVMNSKGIHWELFRRDVFDMCDTVLVLRNQEQQRKRNQRLQQRESSITQHQGKDESGNSTTILSEFENRTSENDTNCDNDDEDDDDQGQRGSVSYSVRKIKEATQTLVDRTGRRHEYEMKFVDDRYKFTLAIESYNNKEAAMQSWRKIPYPERIYERLNADVVCAGLSKVDEKIAAFELKTSLPNSFIGQSYRYDDTGQSEAWMKSVVDETGCNASSSKKSGRRRSSNASNASSTFDPQKAEKERVAALALAADEGVTRAQVTATMQALLIAVQDRVMTDWNVLRQPELRSANWMADYNKPTSSDTDKAKSTVTTEYDTQPILRDNNVTIDTSTTILDNGIEQDLPTDQLLPQIIEQPVWGIDCYTRRNIMSCLQTEFNATTSLLFIEKWLLPAINACPENLGHNISNAARILEGEPFEEETINGEADGPDNSSSDAGGSTNLSENKNKWNDSLLGRSLLHKITTVGPPWLKAAANQLRRARESLGPDFFRVHPKGNGSVVLSATLKPNTLVTFYRGELYPSWRWGEKMDAIDITQSRKDLKPALPDFYNMALERPQSDPRGYGLLFVDASRKAGHGSSLSHSCAPTCEVRVAACEGELCLAMTTLRELEMGEELTFDYNAVTESLNEYRSAVCLCGYGKCRGSFLHFATADCYQQVLNRNCPIASRFSSLVKGSMKQVMSPDDEQIQRNHGFLTAAFGAISVNRRADGHDGIGESLVDSLSMVPVWLRTYVADTLRYIEYERRALPIALICEAMKIEKSKQKLEIQDILHSSKISFQDADAEGVVAMEQRIQQLTQTLSRVGRVLDRHREGMFESKPEQKMDDESMRRLVHAPLRVLTDIEVIRWIWKNENGVILPFLRGVESSRFVRPHFLHTLREVYEKYSTNEHYSDDQCPMERHQIKEALLKLRSLVLQELKVMAKELKQLRADSAIEQTDENVHDWVEYYSERFVLQAAADLLLMYAYTSNFFVFQPYSPLESTPVEVYARELGNAVPRSVIDNGVSDTQEKRDIKNMTSDDLRSNTPVSCDIDSIKNGGNMCAPDDIVAKVSIRYDGQYVQSQLLQWYNAGIGQKPGLPSLLGCVLLPKISDCWCSELLKTNKRTKSDGKTIYETKIRPRLVEWMQDPYERGNPWPQEIYKAFVPEETNSCNRIDSLDSFIAYGSPIIDFLVMGDESNIIDVLYELDADDKITAKKSADGLLTSVDKGRPAQAVSTWVQCENPSCMKWRKIPWYVDADQLPEKFFCKDNEWSPTGNTCDAPEDDWDKDDAMVGSDGKVEGSPIHKKKFEGRLPVNDESSFRIGSRFDVQRSDKKTYSVATVVKVDFSGSIKRIMFHYAKTSTDRDEWVEFGSPRIAPLFTKVIRKCENLNTQASLASVDAQARQPKPLKKKRPKSSDFMLHRAPNGNNIEDDLPLTKQKAVVGSDSNVENLPTHKKMMEGRLDVNDEASFRIGTRFDVQRSDKKGFSIATVIETDFSDSSKRVKFHFAKTSSDRDEWVEFGSSRIAALFTKVIRKRKNDNTQVSQTKPDAPASQTTPLKKKRRKQSGSDLLQVSNRKVVVDGSPLKKQKFDNEKSSHRIPSVKAKPKADPTDLKSFVAGAQFDVYREDKKRFCWAVVVDVDFASEDKKICFRFTKTKDNHIQWYDFGSPHICMYKSKVLPKPKKLVDKSDEVAPIKVKKPKATTLHLDLVVAPTISSSTSHSEDRHSYDSSVCTQQPIPPKHRPPDFVTPASVSSFVVQKNQHALPVNDIIPSNPYAPVLSSLPVHEFSTATKGLLSEKQHVATFLSGGSVPSGWSGLDMLAAVTFDAVPSSTVASSSPEQKSINKESNNRIVSNNNLYKNGEQLHPWSNPNLTTASMGWGRGHDSTASTYMITHNDGEQNKFHPQTSNVHMWSQQHEYKQQQQQQQRWVPSYGFQQQQQYQGPYHHRHPPNGSSAWNNNTPFPNGYYQQQQQYHLPVHNQSNSYQSNNTNDEKS